jgi:hypothetical protein
MAPQAEIDAVRSDIERQLSGIAAVTTALSGMLEVGSPRRVAVAKRTSVCCAP